jgi:PAS domain S-box-containing protein
MRGRRQIDVLYIASDPAPAEALEEQSEDIVVESAPNANRALEKRANRAFDCLVSEYDLPDSDGIELLKTVREEESDLPFVLCVEQGSEAVASDAISADVTEYLRKREDADRKTVLSRRIRDAVEQYWTRQELAESQQRLSLFVEQSPLGVIEWNTDSEVVSINPAAEEILGYAEEELVGEPLEVIVPESAKEEVSSLTENLLETKSGFHNVNENLRKDGEKVVCEWHNRVVTDDDGDVIAVYSQFQDITKREKRREAIADLHEIVDDLTACSSEQAIYERTVEAAGQILDFDQAAVAIEDGDHLRVEAMSEELSLNLPPSLPVDEGIAGKTYQENEPYVIGDVTEVPDASPQSEKFRAAVSVPITGYGIFQVIDNQKNAFDQQDVELAKLLVQHTETALNRLERERELERVHKQVEFALDATDSNVWAVDAENAELETQIGPVESLFNMPTEQITDIEQLLCRGVHPDDLSEIEDLTEQVMSGEKEKFSCVFRTNPDYGDIRWLESLGYAQMDGEHKQVIGLTTDVTDREQREQELQRQNERLEQFASVVSHDLRNPLQVANSWLTLAREDCESEYLDKIGEAHERMDILIADLLRLARSGDQALETERIDLGECSRACWETVDTAEATLSVDVDCVLTADRNRFRQLLANLFRNAVEHGGDAVTVTVGRLSDGFYVEDDGLGIPPEQREAVFDLGYSATEDGTGFGLSIVARVADAHGWTVRAAEGTDGGARFEVTGVEFVEE